MRENKSGLYERKSQTQPFDEDSPMEKAMKTSSKQQKTRKSPTFTPSMKEVKMD